MNEITTARVHACSDIRAHISDIPRASTSSSQKLNMSVLGNWTMTYLNGGMSVGQYRETVAPAGTAPGY